MKRWPVNGSTKERSGQIYTGYPECVKLLLNHPDIDINITSNSGKTPLEYASHYNKTECIKLLKAKKKEQDSLKLKK